MSKDRIIINFTGDISLTGIFYDKVSINSEIFDNKIRIILSNSDYNLCNLEGPTISNKNISKADINIISPANSIKYLRERGFNIYNLANNHIFDFGIEGFLNTRDAILKERCQYFGAGENIKEASKILYIKKNNIVVSVIGLCHKEGLIAGENTPGIFCDEYFDVVKEKVKEAKKESNFVILNYHGGEEYTIIPRPKRRKFLKRLIDVGGDIIIAHHSHVFQGIESFNNKIIFYSLGNFVFDIPYHRKFAFTNMGAIVNFSFTMNNYTYKLFPIYINRESGMIEFSDSDFTKHIYNISSFSKKFYTNWIRDANRVFFNKNLTNNQVNVIEKPKKNKLIRYFFSKEKYIYLYHIMKDKVRRPIFISAIIYKLLNRLGLMN